jgi:hypothetical protein
MTATTPNRRGRSVRLAWGMARETEYAMWEWTRGHTVEAVDAMDRVAMLVRIADL